MRKPQFGRVFKRKGQGPDGRVVEYGPWWIEHYDGHGKQHRESSHSTRYTDAERLLRKRQAEITSGAFIGHQAEQIRVSDLLDDLLADYEINQKSLAWAKYVDGHLRPFFGPLRVPTVGSTAIARYIAERRAEGIANSTINRELSLLRRAFNLARDCTPPKVTHVPKIPKLAENNIRKGFFEHDDYLAMRAALPPELRAILTFAYYTGCRRGEILSLQWPQVDLIGRVVRLEPGTTKNDEGRLIPLVLEVYETLKMQRAIRQEKYPACPWVFFRAGQRIGDFREAWEAACRKAGLWEGDGETGRPAKLFHDLRRTGVRNLVRAGIPEKIAMQISGHKTRSVFDRYNIVDERDVRLAAAKLEQYIQERQTACDKDSLRTVAADQHQEGGSVAANLLQ
jgi:integrase